MDLPSDHKVYLNRRDFVIPPGNFTQEERELLGKYGRWLEALASGILGPLTPTQEQFVKVAQGQVTQGQGEPVTDFERAWLKVVRHRAEAPEVIHTFRVLATARTEAARLEAEYRNARARILAQVQDQLAAVDAEFGPRIQEATDLTALREQEVRALVLRIQHSVKLADVQAIYIARRVTWDGKRLKEYAVINPDILRFQKVGNPTVTVRFLDRLILPEPEKQPAAAALPAGPSVELPPHSSENGQ